MQNDVLRDLQRQELTLRAQLENVRETVKRLEELASPDYRARVKRNRLSARGRDAIAQAAKRRWARYRASQGRGSQAREIGA